MSVQKQLAAILGEKANIDYLKVFYRWQVYCIAETKRLRDLPRKICKRLRMLLVADDMVAVTQANTNECQCQLEDNDVLYNFVAKQTIRDGLRGLFPGSYTNKEILDETFISGIQLSLLLHLATDQEWAETIGRGTV